MLEEKKYCIYRHIRLDKNSIFYIGIGNESRPFVKYNRNKYWNNIINKTNYEIQILKKNLSLEQACELEKILISYYGRKDLGLGNLVNMTDGGEGLNGKLFSKEHRKKLCIARKKRITTEETKLKMKLNHRGKCPIYRKKLSDAAYNSIKVIDITTGIIYNSITICAKILNIPTKTLSNQVKGISKNKTSIKILEYEQI